MPLTSEESAALMNDMTFRGRVKVAMLKYCNTMIDEPNDTSGHTSRARWAQQAKQQPDMYASQLHPSIITDPAIQESGAAATDLQIEGATQAEINKTV